MSALPSLPAPEKSQHSAEQAHPLNTLESGKIAQLVADLDITGSEKEHYLTGWMGSRSLVMIRNYQDNRGTSSGFVLTVPGRYRFSVQAITFRIPKILLWATFRLKPRTMTLVAWQPLGERAKMVQYRNIPDAAVKAELDQQWRDINDYLGEACWQKERHYPLWQRLESTADERRLNALSAALHDGSRALQQDGEFSGLWQGDIFVAIRPAGDSSPLPSLIISWQEEDALRSYLYGWLDDNEGGQTLAMAYRPQKEEAFFTLNRFDARHLQKALALLESVISANTAQA
ncbi:hypothetical protein [Enterobacillus tribolii]|uniref:Uncharacterized protein n=1 Tax=Enterobacillus tribolii TaxID=1487935 RepID=A0A370QS39_9GAMM|nr:hypothetical protein [Enterobacillus tribolii]MBW7983718.1 hypothetical protein [Enterobacillus tribolii]RDK92082.1 hypothetical protein C8D90_104239 [Enterobacillus tribolii]